MDGSRSQASSRVRDERKGTVEYPALQWRSEQLARLASAARGWYQRPLPSRVADTIPLTAPRRLAVQA